MADDFCKYQARPQRTPSPKASLSGSEAVTLVIFSQWARFRSERDFYRYASSHLRSAFPALPRRSQFNRLTQRHYRTQVIFLPPLGGLAARTALPLRSPGRGLLRLPLYSPSQAAHSGGASPQLVCSGQGFEGRELHVRWRDFYRARVISPPKRNSNNPWPKGLRRSLAGIPQIVETVFGKLHHAFGLDRKRPHQLDGFQTRLAARAALHNFCSWLNRHMGPLLAGFR